MATVAVYHGTVAGGEALLSPFHTVVAVAGGIVPIHMLQMAAGAGIAQPVGPAVVGNLQVVEINIAGVRSGYRPDGQSGSCAGRQGDIVALQQRGVL